jgi:hypothetical protein
VKALVQGEIGIGKETGGVSCGKNLKKADVIVNGKTELLHGSSCELGLAGDDGDAFADIVPQKPGACQRFSCPEPTFMVVRSRFLCYNGCNDLMNWERYSMAFTVKLAQYDDMAECARVEYESMPNYPGYLSDAWHYFQNQKGACVCVYDGDEMIGIGRFTVLPDGTGWLETLRVSIPHQGKGAGKVCSAVRGIRNAAVKARDQHPEKSIYGKEK